MELINVPHKADPEMDFKVIPYGEYGFEVVSLKYEDQGWKQYSYMARIDLSAIAGRDIAPQHMASEFTSLLKSMYDRGYAHAKHDMRVMLGADRPLFDPSRSG